MSYLEALHNPEIGPSISYKEAFNQVGDFYDEVHKELEERNKGLPANSWGILPWFINKVGQISTIINGKVDDVFDSDITSPYFLFSGDYTNKAMMQWKVDILLRYWSQLISKLDFNTSELQSMTTKERIVDSLYFISKCHWLSSGNDYPYEVSLVKGVLINLLYLIHVDPHKKESGSFKAYIGGEEIYTNEINESVNDAMMEAKTSIIQEKTRKNRFKKNIDDERSKRKSEKTKILNEIKEEVQETKYDQEYNEYL